MNPRCSQCGRPAIGSVGDQNLCVEHYALMANAINDQQTQLAAMMNMLRDDIADTMGVPRTGGRISLPQPIVRQGDVTNNHINLDHSVVGAINTAAQVKQIDVAMDNVTIQGNDDVAKALKQLSEAILTDANLKQNARDELVEILAFLASQAALPKEQRQLSLIKRTMGTFTTLIATSADLMAIWDHFGKTIVAFFGAQ